MIQGLVNEDKLLKGAFTLSTNRPELEYIIRIVQSKRPETMILVIPVSQ